MKSIETKRRKIEDLENESKELERERERLLSREFDIYSEVRTLKEEICTEVFENLILRDKITEVTHETLQELEEKYPGISFLMSDFRKFMSNLKKTGKISGEAYYSYEEPENDRVASKMITHEGWTENWELFLEDIRAFRNIKVL